MSIYMEGDRGTAKNFIPFIYINISILFSILVEVLMRRNFGTYCGIIFLFFFFVMQAASGGYCQEVNLGFINSRIKKIKNPGGKQLVIWETTREDLRDKNIIASTEEAALVTMVYLRHYELYKSSDSLEKAMDAFRFLYHMQGKNGCFHRYLDKSGKIVGEGTDGECSLNDQTAYAFMALAEGSRIIRKTHPGAYNQLEDSFLQVMTRIKELVESPDTGFGNYVKFQKMKIPGWLVMGRGDLSGMYLVGMSRFYEKADFHIVGKAAKELGQGVMEFKHLEPKVFPQFAHLTYTDQPSIWKTAGAFQCAGLAYGAVAFQRKVWLTEAQNEGVGFLLHLVTSYGPIQGFFPHPDLYPQSPRGAYTLTANFIALYHATGNKDFAKIAGLCAGWFYKNNVTGKPIYSNRDGSCLEKIAADGPVDKKGLDASASALLSIMAILDNPGREYLHYKCDYTHAFQILESEEGKPVNLDFEVNEWEYSHEGKGKVVIIRRNNTFWHKFKVDFADEYFMLLSYQKQLLFSSAVAVNVRIDGGPILLVPLGGAIDTPYMLMQQVTDPTPLRPGLHTVGVRYRGLLLTKPAIIDCSVLQPVMQRKQYSSGDGHKLILVNNSETEKKKMQIPDELKDVKFQISSKSITGGEMQEQFTMKKGKKYFWVPSSGYGILEWK